MPEQALRSVTARHDREISSFWSEGMPPEIVPVDDNDGDIRLIREVLGEVNKTALLQVPHISDYTHPCDFISSR